ncbi:hypothetical protein M441DRAFT_60808 [Trichoderma asperellum CBS 433.97]|uniref:Uncharacterized protein n=1 Tax=Trichoderma asperellum (strain ATCC 204424 / CBS 433.97 / NBRC 101777) TaxID=1042311 RepID=A0A2T3YYI6_TRIA4|nr:hypothetical protein M441DRAFT_60808 [Trichoderma asperellum CBS 433.97]PTB37629.1 hypothetical protein M441DRAFT_60808 [Trichoderma asperellum CBS 433.97]
MNSYAPQTDMTTEGVRLTETQSLLILRAMDYFPKHHSPHSYLQYLYVIWVPSMATVSHVMLARAVVRRPVAVEDLVSESKRNLMSIISFEAIGASQR